MARTPIPSNFFVFTIVAHQGRFLVIRERKDGQRWYAPAGRLEPGETIVEAAVRETMEEAGVAVIPTALLRVEQQWLVPDPDRGGGSELTSWWRFVMTARPTGSDVTPKSFADHHSLEARWLTLPQIAALPLRHPEVLDLFALVSPEVTELDVSRAELPGRARYAD